LIKNFLKATTLKYFLSIIYSNICSGITALYNKANYQGDNQTWNVAQGSDDAMANNHYLLRYDGVKWENMLPNKTIIRSIYVVDDKIYSGSIKNLGMDSQIWEDELCVAKGKAVLTIVKMKKSGRILNLRILFISSLLMLFTSTTAVVKIKKTVSYFLLLSH
jgi:hypothetical protein